MPPTVSSIRKFQSSNSTKQKKKNPKFIYLSLAHDDPDSVVIGAAMERIIGGKYKLGRKIGCGSFGEIFFATHIDTFEIVAVKIVSINSVSYDTNLLCFDFFCIMFIGSCGSFELI
ncbi:unnamed protein product [Arabidopsis lyrata]|uniref:Protein kinase domain-containing protein n=1 Tax=Arabidopsis lyrata subsp. lyrata TaxID=81972 RepID=D7ME41_ARALL|nr:hypothetical protein ARALYDRAFT_914371 [Arabidopsis lyrata subsp. lyrata]CAH8275716.1 unnamed protein product [Arabidopsis lyrata]